MIMSRSNFQRSTEQAHEEGFIEGVEFVLRELLTNEMILLNLKKESGAALKLYADPEDDASMDDLIDAFMYMSGVEEDRNVLPNMKAVRGDKYGQFMR